MTEKEKMSATQAILIAKKCESYKYADTGAAIKTLIAIAERVGDVERIEAILLLGFTGQKDSAEDVSRWLLNGEGKYTV